MQNNMNIASNSSALTGANKVLRNTYALLGVFIIFLP